MGYSSYAAQNSRLSAFSAVSTAQGPGQGTLGRILFEAEANSPRRKSQWKWNLGSSRQEIPSCWQGLNWPFPREIGPKVNFGPISGQLFAWFDSIERKNETFIGDALEERSRAVGPLSITGSSVFRGRRHQIAFSQSLGTPICPSLAVRFSSVHELEFLCALIPLILRRHSISE